MRAHRLRRSALALLLTGAAYSGAQVIATEPAYAASCRGADGVTVVVQTDGGIAEKCAPGNPDSATDALRQAGFAVELNTEPNRAGTVCLIDGYPPDRKCWEKNSYWAFWHAAAGGSWLYSTDSSADYNPSPGSSVGFRFGDGSNPPSTRPASPPPSDEPKPPTTPTPTTKPPPPPQSPTTRPAPPRPPASTRTVIPRGPVATRPGPTRTVTLSPTTSSPGPTSSGASASTSPTPVTTTSTSTPSGDDENSPTAGPPTGPPASAVPAWALATILVGLLVGAAEFARRRRSTLR